MSSCSSTPSTSSMLSMSPKQKKQKQTIRVKKKSPTMTTKMLDDQDDNGDSIGSFPAPSPGRCIYGYVLFLVALLWLVLYHAWAFTPTSIIIEKTAITYIPSKYWAISLPVFFVFLITVFATLLYPGINLLLTPKLSDCSTVMDRYSRSMKTIQRANEACIIPPASDLPLNYVCNQLYL